MFNFKNFKIERAEKDVEIEVEIVFYASQGHTRENNDYMH